MRIIAGEFRSRKLEEVPTKETRETKDRVKEAIFNSIRNQLPGANVLDLFAGSGALGLEAISRGANHTTFVDNAKIAIDTVTKNILSLDVQAKTTVLHTDFENALDKGMTFDIIFLDPPYHITIIDQIIETIHNKKVLSDNGIIIALYSSKVSLNTKEFGIIEKKTKRYGITNVSYLEWRTQE